MWKWELIACRNYDGCNNPIITFYLCMFCCDYYYDDCCCCCYIAYPLFILLLLTTVFNDMLALYKYSVSIAYGVIVCDVLKDNYIAYFLDMSDENAYANGIYKENDKCIKNNNINLNVIYDRIREKCCLLKVSDLLIK